LGSFQPRKESKVTGNTVSVADPDPGSGAFLTPASDPESGIGFFWIPDLGSQTHIFKSFVTKFWVKVLKFFENWSKIFSSAFQK
jgi:hypothetical protein